MPTDIMDGRGGCGDVVEGRVAARTGAYGRGGGAPAPWRGEKGMSVPREEVTTNAVEARGGVR